MIDLTRAGGLGSPPDSAWVEAARSGEGVADGSPIAIRSARPLPTRSRASRPAEVEPIDIAPAEPAPARSISDLFDSFDEVTAPAAEVPGATRSVDRSWVDQQRRSRRNLLIAVAALALLFIAAGIWLRLSASRATAGRALDETATVDDGEPKPAAAIIDPNPPPVIQVRPVEPPPATRETAPTRPTVAVPQEVPARPEEPPQPIRLPTELLAPVTSGAALRAPTQTVAIPAAQFDDLPGVASFKIEFPGAVPSYAFRESDLAGTLLAEPAGRLGYQLVWRDNANKAIPVEVAAITFDRGVGIGTIEVAWRMKALLNRPEVVALTRVLLQNGQMIVAGPQDRRPQTIRFAAPPPVDIELASASTPLRLLALPGAVCTVAETAPGWTARWNAGAATRTSSSAGAEVGTLVFERPDESGGTGASFTLRIAAGWSAVASDLAAQKEAAAKAVAAAETALSRADQEIERLKGAQRTAAEPILTRIADAQASLKLTDTELANRFTNKPSLRELIKSERARLAEQNRYWEAEIEKAQQKRAPSASAHAAALQTLRGFEQLKEMQVNVDLPGKLRVATLRLKAPP